MTVLQWICSLHSNPQAAKWEAGGIPRHDCFSSTSFEDKCVAVQKKMTKCSNIVYVTKYTENKYTFQQILLKNVNYPFNIKQNLQIISFFVSFLSKNDVTFNE